jgi:hypothetical protein
VGEEVADIMLVEVALPMVEVLAAVLLDLQQLLILEVAVVVEPIMVYRMMVVLAVPELSSSNSQLYTI